MNARLAKVLTALSRAAVFLALLAVACGTSASPGTSSVVRQAASTCANAADCDDGQLCTLDLDTYQDAGSPIRRVVVSNPLYGDGKRAISQSSHAGTRANGTPLMF